MESATIEITSRLAKLRDDVRAAPNVIEKAKRAEALVEMHHKVLVNLLQRVAALEGGANG